MGENSTHEAEVQDPICTCCGGTGITYQTERRCACQPPIMTTNPAPVSEAARDAAVDLAHALGMSAEEFTSGACDTLVQAFARFERDIRARHRDLLTVWTKWEAEVLLDETAWPVSGGFQVTGRHYDAYVDLQVKRQDTLSAAPLGRGVSIREVLQAAWDSWPFGLPPIDFTDEEAEHLAAPFLATSSAP